MLASFFFNAKVWSFKLFCNWSGHYGGLPNNETPKISLLQAVIFQSLKLWLAQSASLRLWLVLQHVLQHWLDESCVKQYWLVEQCHVCLLFLHVKFECLNCLLLYIFPNKIMNTDYYYFTFLSLFFVFFKRLYFPGVCEQLKKVKIDPKCFLSKTAPSVASNLKL